MLSELLDVTVDAGCGPPDILNQIFHRACMHLLCCSIEPLIDVRAVLRNPDGDGWSLVARSNQPAARALRYQLPPVDGATPSFTYSSPQPDVSLSRRTATRKRCRRRSAGNGDSAL